MFINDTSFPILRLEIIDIDFFEQILEAAIIGLEDGVLGRQIHRPLAGKTIVEAGLGEIADRIIQVVHAHGDTGRWVIEDFMFYRFAAVLADPFHHQLAGAGNQEIGGAILIAKGVAADDDRIGPTRNQPWHGFDDDRFAKHHAAENVADGAIGRFPHPLEPEFLHTGFVRRDRRALHADAELANGVGRLDGDLVVGVVAALDAEIEVAQIDVEIGQDQLFADPLPNDAGHLVAIEFNDRILDLDFCHLVLERVARQRRWPRLGCRMARGQE